MRFEFNDDSQKICNSADVVNYGIQCDICGNKFQSVSNINGRRYCVGCYYKTFMKDNQKAEIDQLKQQLVETEQKFLEFQEDSIRNEQTYVIELAEKDKEIEKLKLKLDIRAMSLQNINTERIESKRNQTQLAIQELEKVKDRIKHFCNIHSDDYYGVKSQVKGVELDICEEIDNQINELKGEKDVKD